MIKSIKPITIIAIIFAALYSFIICETLSNGEFSKTFIRIFTNG